MNYSIVYEVTNEKLDSVIFIPLIFILIGFGLSYINYKYFDSTSTRGKYITGFGIVFGLFSLIFSLITIPSSLTSYYSTMKKYDQNDFKTIEGEIENFDPMPYGGHKQERFTLNGIEFDYSDFSASYYGFHNTASHGGPIKRNGQEVRIGYITTQGGHNRILKIELKN